MSLLVHYTLKSEEHHSDQIAAMTALVDGLKEEAIEGLHYSCFSTDDPLKFVGVLEYANETAKQAFLNSAAFSKYRETVGPTFANPPETTDISSIASTHG